VDVSRTCAIYTLISAGVPLIGGFISSGILFDLA
jgi:hypothetical protein